ncbi:MAG: ATP-binding protein [Lysobacterales bacterium]
MTGVAIKQPEHGPALVGRDSEQQAILRILADLRAGQGQVVLLNGEPGIGKSSLARWAAFQAARTGVPVHAGFAWEAGGAPPYWPWTQCLRSLLDDRELPPRLAAPLAQLLPELAPDDAVATVRLQPDQARFQLLEAVRSLLADTAAAQPFMLVLEDLHAADRESLLLLQHVCQHAAQAGYLVLGTFRELEARLGDASSPLWRCAREALVLPLQGLREQDVQALLERQVGRPAPSERVQQILATTEGNPLFLTELLALLSGDLIASEQLLPVPGSVRQVIRQHLETLPPDSFRALATAAVLGREFNTPSLAALLRCDENAAAGALQPALEAALLRPAGESTWRFAHLFHRDVLYACLELDERQDLHLRRAADLEPAVASGLLEAWAELAEHYSAAGPAYRRRAISAWRAAAGRAAERLAFTESAALLRRALQAFGAGPEAEPSQRCELLIQAAEANLRAGDIEDGHALCRDAFQLARTLQDAGLMARAALTYGSAFTIGKIDPDLLRLLHEALAALARGAGRRDSGLQARLQARLAAALQPALQPAEPIAMARDAVALARSTGDRRALFETLTSAVSALMDFVPAEEHRELSGEYARLAEEFDDVPAQFRAHTMLFITGLELADPSSMDAALDQCEWLAQRIDLPHYQWRVHSARALQAVIHGDFDRAAQRLNRAQEAAAQAEDPMAEMTLSIQAFGLLAARGESGREEVDAAQRRIAQAFEACGADDVFVRPFIARYRLSLGDEVAAQSACSPGTVDRLLAMREMSNIQSIGDCAVLRGDRELARRVFDVLAAAPPPCGHGGLYGMNWNGPTALTLARLCVLLDEPERAGRYLQEALEVAERMGAQPLVRQISAELDAQGALPQSAPQPVSPAAGPTLEMTAAGDFWQVRFADQQAAVKDSKGLQILARLLDNPGREFHVLDLNAVGGGGAAVTASAADEAALTGLDDQARDDYRGRLREIAEALDEARTMNDSAAVEQLLEEQDALQRELARAFGLGGRRRASGSAAERARVNVTRRIRDAIGKLGEHLPDAGRYLDNTIKTGTYCRFSPM